MNPDELIKRLALFYPRDHLSIGTEWDRYSGRSRTEKVWSLYISSHNKNYEFQTYEDLFKFIDSHVESLLMEKIKNAKVLIVGDLTADQVIQNGGF